MVRDFLFFSFSFARVRPPNVPMPITIVRVPVRRVNGHFFLCRSSETVFAAARQGSFYFFFWCASFGRRSHYRFVDKNVVPTSERPSDFAMAQDTMASGIAAMAKNEFN